jgi:hypothetical protein
MYNFGMLLQMLKAEGVEIWSSEPASEFSINLLEKELKVVFTPQYRLFLRNYGALSVSDIFVAGIVDNSPLQEEGGGLLYETNRLVQMSGSVPVGLVAISRHEDGAYCLDVTSKGYSDEFTVVNFDASEGWNPYPVGTCFVDFFIRRVFKVFVKSDLDFRDFC